jgi:hypothetical protein
MFETPLMLQDAQEPIWVAGYVKGLDVDIQCVRPPTKALDTVRLIGHRCSLPPYIHFLSSNAGTSSSPISSLRKRPKRTGKQRPSLHLTPNNAQLVELVE